MYDDASYYYSFNSSALSPSQRRSSIAKHKRKQSLLEKSSADADHASNGKSGAPDALLEEEPLGPPEATLKRRADSYTDFHHAASAVLKQSASLKPKGFKVEKESERLVKNELDFVDWYEQLENGLIESSHSEYEQYRKQLELSESHLTSLLSDTDSALDLLESLSKSFKDVEAQTLNFRSQSEGLLKQQRKTEDLADQLDQNLKYYNYLEPVTRRLNAPGAGSLVRSKGFSEMLARVDDCLNYLSDHLDHREAPTYLSRYRLLMTRGLTLVRVNFVGGLRDIATDVSRRIADGQLKETTMSALLYAKFRVGAAELKELAQEIRKRTALPPGSEPGAEAEYQSLMNELYTSYSATRGKLVIPMARKRIADIAMAPSTSKDLVSFARSSIGYTRGICSDEYDLWKEWFEGEGGLYDFLESVCEPLYDHLRPRIIHETQLLRLCELCTLLQTRYMHNPDEEAEPIETHSLDFSLIIHPALEDAQTRLVFRTQTILRDEIERYKPKKEELDYPSRNRRVSLSGTKSQRPTALSGRKNSVAEPTTPIPKTPMVVEEGDSPRGRWGFETEAAFEGWYPTLRKAIWLLSRIYRLVNSVVFDDLAHNIVHATTLSLIHASALITSTHPHTNPHDARLFLIKHLLLLKHQILAFDIEYVHHPDATFDFSLLTTLLATLRTQGTSALLPANIWRLLTTTTPGSLVPKVITNMLDAKTELDSHLRTVINDFTTAHASLITNPIDTSSLAKPRFEPLSAVAKVKTLAEKEVPLLRRRLEAYLDDARTRETLIAAVRDQVLADYESFYDLWTERLKKDGKGTPGGRGAGGRSKKGKGREDEVWDMDMFGEWAGGMFDVGRLDSMGLDGGGDGDSDEDGEADSLSE